MFAQLPERQMHVIRWVLTIGWLLVIASLFYDPWTPALTEQSHPWSPLRLTGECVQVQGTCIAEAPYAIGAILFWGRSFLLEFLSCLCLDTNSGGASVR